MRVVANKMHDGGVDIDAQLVHRLLVSQFPHLCDLPLEELRSTGTVNAIHRLGNDLCVRLPRIQWWARDLEKELEWLPKLAPRLPLVVPEPVARGEPGSGYPFAWAIYRWIGGETFAGDRVGDECQAAAWEIALEAPEWDGIPVWRHCDLLAPNLLVAGGRLVAIIDSALSVSAIPRST